jgi:hypothetical protein
MWQTKHTHTLATLWRGDRAALWTDYRTWADAGWCEAAVTRWMCFAMYEVFTIWVRRKKKSSKAVRWTTCLQTFITFDQWSGRHLVMSVSQMNRNRLSCFLPAWRDNFSIFFFVSGCTVRKWPEGSAIVHYLTNTSIPCFCLLPLFTKSLAFSARICFSFPFFFLVWGTGTPPTSNSLRRLEQCPFNTEY